MSVQLFSQKLGSGTNAARRCSDIAVTHGFLGNCGNWATVGRKLTEHPLVAERLRHAYALDMRNHGRSPHTPTHSNALMAADVDRFVVDKMVGRHNNTISGGAVASSVADDDQISGQHVLIGHSMGGAVTMNVIYRRWLERWRSENSLAAPPMAEVAPPSAIHVGGGGESESFVHHGRVGDQDNFYAMGLVPAASAALKPKKSSSSSLLLGGDTAEDTVDDSVWCFEPPTTLAQSKNRVAAAVIVDITPTMSTHRPATFDSVQADLNAMKALDLLALHSVQEGTAMLEALGVKSSQMRNFLLTNLERVAPPPSANGDTTNSNTNVPPPQPTYKWKCNLDVLWRDFHNILLPLDTFDHSQYASILPPPPCPMPVMFVFGEKSPYYNNRAEREKISKYFSNVEEVVVPDAGHFVHYEKMNQFVDLVAPFVYEHMGI